MPATVYNSIPLVFTRSFDEFGDRLDVHFNEPRWDEFEKEFGDVLNKYDALPLTEATEQFNVGLTTAATKFYCDEGVPFLRGENVYERGIDLTSETFVPEEQHNEWVSSQVKPGYIVINLVGNIGDACVIPESILKAQINRALGRIIPKEDVVSSEYLIEFLNSDLGKGQFIRYSQGGMQRRFNHPDGCYVRVPLLEDYSIFLERINYVKGLKGKLIAEAQETEKRRTELLDTIVENIATEIGLSKFPRPWFGRLYFQKAESEIDRFDVLGANPQFEDECWTSGKFVPLSDVCEVDGSNEQIPLGTQQYISIDSLPGNYWGDIDIPEMKIEAQTGRTHFFPGDIAWAHLKPSILKGKAYIIHDECWGSHHFLKLNTSKVSEDLRTIIWAYLKTGPIKRHLANKCTGKSESQKDVSDKALGMLPFPKLDDNQIKRVASAIRDTIGKSHELEAQENEYRDKADDLLRKAKSNIFNLLDDSWFNDLVSEAKEALQ